MSPSIPNQTPWAPLPLHYYTAWHAAPCPAHSVHLICRGRGGQQQVCLYGQGWCLNTEFVTEMGSGGNFSLLLAVYWAQPSPPPLPRQAGQQGLTSAPGSFPPSTPRKEWVSAGLGTKQRHVVFAVVIKEHLFLGKVVGPRMAGSAAGSARRRHGKFCCAFLKERKEETSQPNQPARPLRHLQGQRPGRQHS